MCIRDRGGYKLDKVNKVTTQVVNGIKYDVTATVKDKKGRTKRIQVSYVQPPGRRQLPCLFVHCDYYVPLGNSVQDTYASLSKNSHDAKLILHQTTMKSVCKMLAHLC
eukprot:TRINITY_DN14682_c0_g1_i2.p2 TRINITY_DN14682_c0_g1~~TRINITY_DN14682_c0_g1_i2.p2  ORF type:complete len:108 (+),score=8.64 TRINITY_DN14682_c0_g1_i2:64-387(+)